MIDESRKAKIIEELRAMAPQPYNSETDIYPSELSRELCIDEETAVRLLRVKVANGEMIEIDNVMLPNKRVGRAFRLV